MEPEAGLGRKPARRSLRRFSVTPHFLLASDGERLYPDVRNIPCFAWHRAYENRWPETRLEVRGLRAVRRRRSSDVFGLGSRELRRLRDDRGAFPCGRARGLARCHGALGPAPASTMSWSRMLTAVRATGAAPRAGRFDDGARLGLVGAELFGCTAAADLHDFDLSLLPRAASFRQHLSASAVPRLTVRCTVAVWARALLSSDAEVSAEACAPSSAPLRGRAVTGSPTR